MQVFVFCFSSPTLKPYTIVFPNWELVQSKVLINYIKVHTGYG